MKKFPIMIPFIILNQFVIAQTGPDHHKNGYTLFKPVPKEEMRDIETDRPDVTESAYTVDAGHFQYESDLFKTVRNKASGVLSIQYIYNHANLKLGLTNTTDFQAVIESYIDNATEHTKGFGDITLRIKQNLWGNDGGKTALAVMPYINLPTSKFSESNVAGGGIVFPFAAQLTNDWGFGTQLQMDLLKNRGDENYHSELLYSFTFSRGLTSGLNFFVESAAAYNFMDTKGEAMINGGLIYSVSRSFKIDAGFNCGITKAADKVYFAGLSFRY